MKADSTCIFCKIVAGQIPATKVLEDQWCVAFMDLGPLAEGHVLVISKGHYVTLDQMPVDQAAGMLGNLPALVRAVQAATACEGVNILQNNGQAAHQVVQHVHFHIIPRKSGDSFHFNWPAGQYPPGRMQQVAQAIKEQLNSKA